MAIEIKSPPNFIELEVEEMIKSKNVKSFKLLSPGNNINKMLPPDDNVRPTIAQDDNIIG
jgi:hypothetical protein